MGILKHYYMPGFWWVRLWGLGIHGKNTAIHPLTFSERHGKTRRVQLGFWSFKILKPCKK